MSNRKRSRAARDARASLRSAGCNCHVRLEPIPATDCPPGAAEGWKALHAIGCPLGDRVALVNAAGILPAFSFAGRPRCKR